MAALRQDLVYAIRWFARAPAFMCLALVTLGIGIGVNATVFTFISALLIRPSPGLNDAGSLVSIHTSDYSSGIYGTSSYPDFVSIQSEAPAFREAAAYSSGPMTVVRIQGHVERLRTMAVSGEFFQLLGLRPAAGRLLDAADATAAAPVAIIGASLWQRAFGGAPSAVGTQIVINDAPFTIVGIAPEGFQGLTMGNLADVWTPLRPRTAATDRGNRGLSIVARLAPGIDRRQAQTQLDGVAARLAAAFPASNRGTLARPDDPRPMTVVPQTRLHPRFRSEIAMLGAILVAAVALVLLIACANVAGLLLSRATSRAREVGVRRALGASSGRIVRQMLTESMVLAIAGGAVGLLFALWTSDVLPSFFPEDQAGILDARVDWTVLMFTAATALASGLMFGLAPALHGLRSGPGSVLRHEGRGDGSRTVRLRSVLVVSQVALASVLLVSATLLTRSLANAANADLGFSTRNAVVASIELPSSMTPARGLAYYDTLISTIAAIPGVEQASVARVVPVAGGSRRIFAVPGYVPRPGEDMELHINTVDQQYFSTIGMRPSQGRVFASTDALDAPVVVVNEALATRYFGGDAVGRRIRMGSGPDLEIIGIVPVNRRNGIQDAVGPVVFLRLGRDFTTRAMLVARTTGDPRLLADTIRRRATAVDENVAIFRSMPLDEHLADGVLANRLAASLVGVCGALAFVLAVVGVYGVVAYAVVRRTREIGVRIALGARPGQVLGLILREGGRVVGVGVAVGVAAALASTRLLDSLLHGISPTDVATCLGVAAAVAVSATLASCVPAMRALRITPTAALRHE